MIRLLLDKGADPSLGHFLNYCPLDEAVSNSNIQVVRVLLERGADPNYFNRKCRDCSGTTSL
jgi:ankyrin repeat protein